MEEVQVGNQKTIGIDEFGLLIGLSRNGIIKAIKENRIRSAFKDSAGVWKFVPEKCVKEYNEFTSKGKSRNFDEGGPGYGPVTDEEIDKRRSVLTIPHEKWTTHEAEQASAIYEALESKLDYEAKQGKYYKKDDTDKKFHRLTKIFADGLKSIPDEMRQRSPNLDKKDYKLLEKIVEEIRKNVSKEL